MNQVLSDYLREQTETQKKKLEKFVRAFNDAEAAASTRESNRAAAQKMLAAAHLSREFLEGKNKVTIQNGGNE